MNRVIAGMKIYNAIHKMDDDTLNNVEKYINIT